MNAIKLDADRFHEGFNDTSADLILVSSDGIKFRVHSAGLRNGSAFFQDMLSAPRPASEDGIMPLAEHSSALVLLLGFVCKWDFPKGISFEETMQLISSMIKYDMAGPLDILAQILPSASQFHPLQRYVFASRMASPALLATSLTRTVLYDIHAAEHESLLLMLETKDLWTLVKLHRKRHDTLIRFFNAVHRDRTITAFCAQHGARSPVRMNDAAPLGWWSNVSRRVTESLTSEPTGDEIMSREFEQWAEIKAEPSSFHCTQCGGSNFYVTKTAMLGEIRDAIRGLPTTL